MNTLKVNTTWQSSQLDRRQVTRTRAAEIYLFMSSGGNLELVNNLTVGEVEGLFHPNGATFEVWLGWNQSLLSVVDIPE